MKFQKEFKNSFDFANLTNFNDANESLFNEFFISNSSVFSCPDYLFFDNFITDVNFLNSSTYSLFFNIIDFAFLTSLKFFDKSLVNSNSIISFIDQIDDAIDDLNLYHNLENITSIYHYSTPNVKICYPEPFIASPSFMHTDLWFVHILLYQYWLWFFFIFLIVFFFLTFLCTLRWCNMRIRPRRETRGVSRSKCGDLITATVPVTWAISIIVNESTDAIDYYDGFGTTELVVGIRAYQWGWEYYYPKDVDLNYNIKPSYSKFVGNSLKYTKTSDSSLTTNNLWKYYQNKTNDQVITPAHILTLPLDNYKLLNFLNFNDVGANSAQEINAFKKIRMFSKTYTSNLVYLPNSYSQKYKALSSLYINDTLFTDSYSYGLKRQHNFLSSQALINNQSTFFNLNSVNKFVNFNFKNNLSYKTNLNNLLNLNYFKKINNLSVNSSFFNLSNVFNKMYLSDFSINLNNSLFYSNFISNINDNSDKPKINYPFNKLFNSKLKKNNFFNFNSINQLNNNSNDSSLLDFNSENSNYFFNFNSSYKLMSTFSNNQSILSNGRFIRNFMNNSAQSSHYNYSLNLNTVNDSLSNVNKNIGFTNSFLLDLVNTDWINDLSANKHLSAKISLDYPYSPIISNNPFNEWKEYDSLSNTWVDNVPNVLQAKEEAIPSLLTSIYWNFYWSNSNIDLKFNNNIKYTNIHKSFYLPMFSFYYDYDFRNWQSLELLEDAYWESIYSIYTHDEYLNLAKDFYEYESADKINSIYNNFNKNYKFKNKILTKPLFKDVNSVGKTYSNSFYLDDYITPTNLLISKNFYFLPLFSGINNLEDSYESLKYLNYFYNNNGNKIFLNSINNSFLPHSYLSVFDSFRSDFDDFSWYVDDLNQTKTNSNFLNQKDFSNLDDNVISLQNNLDNKKLDRFTNNLNLRNTVKNSIVTYSAIQKVFKTRFDESRSNAKLSDMSNMYTKQPFISASRVHYEDLLGKNKNSFFKINFYKNNFQNYFNNFYDSSSSLNFYFFDFPFLLALKSDSSRYLWFDWFAKWGFLEVQPSSSSRYAIYGMPYFSKNFEFNSNSNETLNETENYFLRLSKSRRNYLPNWTYTPYFYAKNVSWYKNNIMFEVLNNNKNNLNSTLFFLNNSSWYWNSLYFINYHNFMFNPSFSGNSSYTKLNWKPQTSIQSYYYNVSELIDILTKREFLYREYFSNNNKIVNLPFFLTNNPNNPLINEVKASFFFMDPINNNNEYSRDVYFNSLNFFNYLLLKSFLNTSKDFLNLNFLTDYLFYYFFSNNYNNSLQFNSELYKNQYRPMKKGITNMIRLHATGAIALPIEIRLQVLASSKDVIHSWAIPSAGIKIDCVPGYSSHKVMVFLVSGIFWGQCMEICGRYHHWMPIVVYFLKRDLFFLWCTHFVFLSGPASIWNINDRQYTDYTKTVSFDKYSWLTEISK